MSKIINVLDKVEVPEATKSPTTDPTAAPALAPTTAPPLPPAATAALPAAAAAEPETDAAATVGMITALPMAKVANPIVRRTAKPTGLADAMTVAAFLAVPLKIGCLSLFDATTLDPEIELTANKIPTLNCLSVFVDNLLDE